MIQLNHAACQILNNHCIHQMILRVHGDQIDRQLTRTFVDTDKLGLNFMCHFHVISRFLHCLPCADEIPFARQLNCG